MIDLAYFEGVRAEAEDILAALGRGVTASIGHPSSLRLVGELDEATRGRILEIEAEAFGPDADVFDSRALAEVAADPDALLIVVEIDGAIEGFCAGYYETPGAEIVDGAAFFMDTAAMSPRWRGRGVASLAIAGVLLLVHLIGDVPRVGLAVWAENADRLTALYGRFGFSDTPGHHPPWRCMSVELTDERVAGWRAALGLPPRPAARTVRPAGAGG